MIPLEGTKPIAAEETAPVTTEASSLPAASSPETAPKPTKRNSIFGSLFGKKEPTSPTAKEFASPLSAKDSEISPVSATAPQIGEPVITSSAEPAPAAPAPAAEISETAPVTTTTATAAAAPSPPATGTEKRRSSFFNNLGSRREKRPDAMSDTEVTDGEGKKSNPSKFGGLFRKPSRATPTKKSAVDPNASVPTAVKEPADGSAPAGNGTPTIIEPSTEPAGTAGLEHKTPVSASA